MENRGRKLHSQVHSVHRSDTKLVIPIDGLQNKIFRIDGVALATENKSKVDAPEAREHVKPRKLFSDGLSARDVGIDVGSNRSAGNYTSSTGVYNNLATGL